MATFSLAELIGFDKWFFDLEEKEIADWKTLMEDSQYVKGLTECLICCFGRRGDASKEAIDFISGEALKLFRACSDKEHPQHRKLMDDEDYQEFFREVFECCVIICFKKSFDYPFDYSFSPRRYDPEDIGAIKGLELAIVGKYWEAI